MEPAIAVEGLNKVFKVAQTWPGLRGALQGLLAPAYREVAAVSDVSFSIRRGERVAFVGQNGAGKSTTLKMLTGILHPTAGEARVCGLVPWRDRTRLAYRIGAVFGQRSQLFYHLPATATFALLARVYDQDPMAHALRRDALIDAFGLAPFLSTPVHKLSLGQRMRCEIAASLLHAPEVVFLDEPTIGLDVSAKAAIRDVLREQSQQDLRTIVLTSHDTGDMERVCERVIIIHDGKVLRDQSLSALRRSYIDRKRVTVHTAEPELALSLTGVRVWSESAHCHELEVDTRRIGLQAVLSAVMKQVQVVDLAIADPPMEEIVAAIYRDASAPARTLGEAVP